MYYYWLTKENSNKLIKNRFQDKKLTHYGETSCKKLRNFT